MRTAVLLLFAVGLAATAGACGGGEEAVRTITVAETVTTDAEETTTGADQELETADPVSPEDVEACVEESARADFVQSEEDALSVGWDAPGPQGSVSITFLGSEGDAREVAADVPTSLHGESIGAAVMRWDAEPWRVGLEAEADAVRACLAGGEPPPVEPPPPPPNPEATVRRNCTYILGDFTESATGYRFLADARIRNTGNVGVVVAVRATWDQVAAAPIRETKRVRVKPGQARKVNFVRVASQEELELHQSVEQYPACRVKATIVDTFGEASD